MLWLPRRKRICHTCGGRRFIFGRHRKWYPCPDCCDEGGSGGSAGSGQGSGTSGSSMGSTSGPVIITAPCSDACIDGRIPTRLLLIVSGVALGSASPGCENVDYFNGSFVLDYCGYFAGPGCCYASPIECEACCLQPTRPGLDCPSPAERWKNLHSHWWQICIRSYNPAGPVTQATRLDIFGGHGLGNLGACFEASDVEAECPDDCATGDTESKRCGVPGVSVALRFADKQDCATLSGTFDATAPGLSTLVGSGAPWLDTSNLYMEVTAA